ncbi:hypothetical protein ES702_02816 [subsurface metagenome]
MAGQIGGGIEGVSGGLPQQNPTPLVYEKAGVTVIPIGTTSANPIVLAQWKKTSSTGLDQAFFTVSYLGQFEGRRTAGASSLVYAIAVSNDGVNFFDEQQAVFSGGAFQMENGNFQDRLHFEDESWFQVRVYANDGTTSGEIQNAKSVLSEIIPINNTVAREI